MTQAKMFDTAAHRLLDDLDTRHDQLLVDLDALCTQVDQVLSQYIQVRPEAAPALCELHDDEEEEDDKSSESD